MAPLFGLVTKPGLAAGLWNHFVDHEAAEDESRREPGSSDAQDTAISRQRRQDQWKEQVASKDNLLHVAKQARHDGRRR